MIGSEKATRRRMREQWGGEQRTAVIMGQWRVGKCLCVYMCTGQGQGRKLVALMPCSRSALFSALHVPVLQFPHMHCSQRWNTMVAESSQYPRWKLAIFFISPFTHQTNWNQSSVEIKQGSKSQAAIS